MKSTTIIFLAILLLIAAVAILEPILVAQPPDGVVAQPSRTSASLVIGIVAFSVLSWLSMKILSVSGINSMEIRSEAVEFTDSNHTVESASDRPAILICWIGVLLSGLLMIATIVAAIMSLSPGHDEGGRGMAIGIVYFMVIPSIAIAAGLFCLVGARMCKKALRSKTSQPLLTALRVAMRIPLIGIMWWIAGLVFMVGFGK